MIETYKNAPPHIVPKFGDEVMVEDDIHANFTVTNMYTYVDYDGGNKYCSLDIQCIASSVLSRYHLGQIYSRHARYLTVLNRYFSSEQIEMFQLY